MSEQVIQALTAAGAPYEYAEATVHGKPCRVFRHAAQCMSELYASLQQHGPADLAVYDDRRLSYAEAYQQAASLAAVLRDEYKVGPGTRVALTMRNSPEWLTSFIAITSLGGIAALVNSRGAADEMIYSITSTRCEMLISDQKTRAVIGDDLDQMPELVFDLASSFTATAASGTALKVEPDLQLPHTMADTDDTALILFTSGTTGRPKGALLSHRGVLNALKANEFSTAIIGAVMAEKMGLDLATLAAHAPQPATLLMFPLFHVSGCYSVFLANMIKGGKLVMMSRWDADQALQFIAQEKVTTFPGVPTMYWDLLNNAALQDNDVSSLQSLSVAGQSTPISLLKQIKDAFPAATLGSGYGMTETNGVICMIHGEEFMQQPDSVGRPLSIAELKIAGSDGTAVAAGESGEICVRGATVMQGYDNQPQANQAVFKDGWFHTGDVGRFDTQGKLYIVDRLTEMIITGGENVYCAEVERVLSAAPGVMEVTTFGVADERLGERLIAMVGLSDGSDATEEAIMQAAATQLASYKLPAELYILDQPLPRNATGKVLKAGARDIYQRLANS
ncbi:MAG: acyl--CoA ligase [Gammaproteobacteria bacterium]|nr:acyl--CoA ligase [Gammaproteobacteria bacterium]